MRFLVDVAGRTRRHLTLFDASGFALCRTRAVAEMLTTIESHLAFAAQVPAESEVRLRAQAVTDGTRTAIGLWPLFHEPLLTVDQLREAGLELIDTTEVVLDVPSATLVPPESSSSRGRPPALGHWSRSPGVFRVSLLLAPKFYGLSEPTPGLVAHALATTILTQDRKKSLEAAAALAAAIPFDLAALDSLGRVISRLTQMNES